MNKVLAVALFFLLSGCAAHDAKINPMLNSMSQIDQAIVAFGPPSNAFQLPDGSSTYVWGTSRNITVGGTPIYQPNAQTYSGNVYGSHGQYAGSYTGYSTGGTMAYTPVENITLMCELKIIADQQGSIKTWSYYGNDCDRLIRNPNVPLPAPKSSVSPENGFGAESRKEERKKSYSALGNRYGEKS